MRSWFTTYQINFELFSTDKYREHLRVQKYQDSKLWWVFWEKFWSLLAFRLNALYHHYYNQLNCQLICSQYSPVSIQSTLDSFSLNLIGAFLSQLLKSMNSKHLMCMKKWFILVMYFLISFNLSLRSRRREWSSSDKP